MDPKMQAIFEPLRLSLTSRPMVEADIFDLIGEFAGMSPQHAQAFAFHARDIRAENPNGEYNDLIAEVYRRTFYDADTAPLYGTGQMLDAPNPEDLLTRFTAHLIEQHLSKSH